MLLDLHPMEIHPGLFVDALNQLLEVEMEEVVLGAYSQEILEEGVVVELAQ